MVSCTGKTYYIFSLGLEYSQVLGAPTVGIVHDIPVLFTKSPVGRGEFLPNSLGADVMAYQSESFRVPKAVSYTLE